MFEIPNMSLDTARDELGEDFARRIDVDFKHSKCIWCKAGGTKTKKNNHSPMDCPTTKPAENDQTSLSNEIFNAGEGDAAIAYIHQKQLSMYPRDDNATTFSTGFPRPQMSNYTVSVKTAPAPPSAPSGPSFTPITPVPSPQPPGGPAFQGMLSSVPSTSIDQGSSGFASSSVVPTTGSTPAATAPIPVIEDHISLTMMPGRPRPVGKNIVRDGIRVGPSKQTVEQLQALATHDIVGKYPIRKGFAEPTHDVYTNHYDISITHGTILYEYKILPAMSGKNKRRIRAIIKAAIENSDFLKNNKRNFATDYFETIIAWEPLHGLIGPEFTRTIGDGATGSEWKLDDFEESGTVLPLRFKFERIIDTKSLVGYKDIDPACADTDIQPIIRALNILISKCFDESTKYQTLQSGANKFYLKDAYENISIGEARNYSRSLCAMRGYNYTIKPGIGRLLLNINAAMSAFFLAGPLEQVLNDKVTFKDFKGRDYEALVRGLRVYINYDRGDKNQDLEAWKRLNSKEGRTKTIQGLGTSLSTQDFELKPGKYEFVQQYFEKMYKRKLAYPELWAVNLGSRHDPRWYCPEDLIVLPYQMYKGPLPETITAGMLDVACHVPFDAAALIDVEALETVEIPKDANTPRKLARCPILTIDPRMLMVPSAREPYPMMRYANRTIQAKDRWSTIDMTLLHRNENKTLIGIVIADNEIEGGYRISPDSCYNALRTFAGPPTSSGDVQKVNTKDRQLVDRALRGAVQARTNFAMLILKNKSAEPYAHFKNLCDRVHGLHSICVTQTALSGPARGQLMGNLMLKMNLKTGGSNHCVADGKMKEILPDTLVLGADVTHPGKGSLTGCPSIAAIVGSVDDLGGHFLGSMRLQSKEKKEIIDEVKDMVVERINDWVEKHGGAILPTNILYYRDGVGDSQYSDIKTTELAQIQLAFDVVVDDLRKRNKISSSVIPKINITAIICAKRHNTRFYPALGEEDKTENCLPGTFVDDVVCSPYYQDFYLQSHCTLKGTARPAHYFIIQNNINKSVDELRQLTHELCYSYVRATVGVSYASPAYYADRLCERGRIYLRDFFVRTANGEKRRNELEAEKQKKENELSKIRMAKFGVERNINGRKRPKTVAELQQESDDKKTVEETCKRWVMKAARKDMYGGEDAPGKNPWHKNTSKTMFWM
ncbi:unnamed protein product [Alternaria alternata]